MKMLHVLTLYYRGKRGLSEKRTRVEGCHLGSVHSKGSIYNAIYAHDQRNPAPNSI